ncbi:MAG: ABC transporter ATP-binding protein [Myxococcales bacterium]|nr:ABC transporter ATP-binding protein [Myxococcota bacterium]MDW8284129.1 ABC transporter ATP-binding protein [Myxococcales bacterium]
MERLEVVGLTCRYGRQVVVHRLSFSVGKGEVVGLLGPNGAGKSTVLQVLCGLRLPWEGRLMLDGKPFSATDPQLRRRLGVVFQDPSLDEGLTGRENLRLLAALYGLSSSTASARIDEALGLVGLAERQHDLVACYSGGMKRRLELARVLLHRPELLLMDEPSRGLDAAALRRYWTQLRAWQRQQGLSILVVTHLPDEAEFCDRLLVLDRGQLLVEGTPQMLRQRVGGDVLTIEAEDAKELAKQLQLALGEALSIVRSDEETLILCAREGHLLIPRLLAACPPGRLRSVAMRRPTLGDVFVQLTGRTLEGRLDEPATI